MRQRVFRNDATRLRRERTLGIPSKLCLPLVAAGVLGVAPVSAQEVVSYAYDSRGRLVQVVHSGSVNDGLTATYAYDKVENRTSVVVSTSPGVSVANASVTEGGTLAFTLTRSGSASVSFSVSYATANGTAIAGSDYTAASGTVTFAASEMTKVASVSTTHDTAFEGNETVLLNLSNPTAGANILDGQAVGTIVDNDPPPAPSFAINDVWIGESGTLSFTVTKTGSTSSGLSVNYATANGTATAGSDYASKSGTLSFAASETAKTITVTTIHDTLTEADETLFVNLSGATGGSTISDAQGIGSIIDDDEDWCLNAATADQPESSDRSGADGDPPDEATTAAGDDAAVEQDPQVQMIPPC